MYRLIRRSWAIPNGNRAFNSRSRHFHRITHMADVNATIYHRGRNIDLTRGVQLAIDSNDNVSKPLFNGRLYNNPWSTWQKRGIREATKWILTRNTAPMPTLAQLDKVYPVLDIDWEKLRNVRPNELQVTWIGHASFLVQMGGFNFLCDPVFSDRCSPVQFMGPKRYRPTPLTLDQLPPIDFVIISHNHYDHLDSLVVETLGDDVVWIVPKGNKQWFTSMNVHRVVELSWWEKFALSDDMFVVCLPCQHWSKRTLFDDMQALWGSFAVINKHHRFYFSGDTGYCTGFKEIGDRFGPFDLCLLPIGAYCPEDFMKPQHVNPEEAVSIHVDLRSKCSIGMHYGTFVLTDEHVFEPPQRLAQALQSRGIDPNAFITIKHGETWKYDEYIKSTQMKNDTFDLSQSADTETSENKQQ